MTPPRIFSELLHTRERTPKGGAIEISSKQAAAPSRTGEEELMFRSGWLWVFLIGAALLVAYLFVQVVNPWFTSLTEVLGGN